MSRRFLITAGPTREPIDAVRFLGNRSSGAMGVAIANAARADAHDVTLLLGPADSAVAAGVDGTVDVVRFETTAELEALLAEHVASCDVLVMAAAVADYRAAEASPGKLERKDDVTLRLEVTPDLVAGCAASKRADQKVIAFALEESAELEARAVAKMRRKGVDAVVANPLTTMDASVIDAVWLTADGTRESPGVMDKVDFAAWLMKRITTL